MKIIIFLAGPINQYEKMRPYLNNADLIICCDGGLEHAFKMDVTPNYIFGDFDSVDTKLLKAYIAKGIDVSTFPTKKDFTDFELAMDFAITKQPSEIFVLGGIGGRLDHTIANVHVLVRAMEKGINTCLLSEDTEIYVTNNSLTLNGEIGETVSLVPLTSEVTSIETSGLEYPLSGESLKIGYARGISNTFTSKIVCIRVGKGILAVIKIL